MVVVVAPPPEEMLRKMKSGKGMSDPAKSLKTNIVQMRKAFAAWNTTKSNAQLEPLLVEMVESIDSLYVLMKKQNLLQIE
jgi:hypothetical protein